VVIPSAGNVRYTYFTFITDHFDQMNFVTVEIFLDPKAAGSTLQLPPEFYHPGEFTDNGKWRYCFIIHGGRSYSN